MTAAKDTGVGARGVVTASIAAALGLALLLGLGTWQLQRKAWKETLIATVTARITQPPQPLLPRAQWPTASESEREYAHVRFTGTFLPGEAFVYTAGSSLRPDVTDQGSWVFAPARLADGGVLLVNRGFVPTPRKDPATRAQVAPGGPVDIVGYMRWPEAHGLFAPTDDAFAKLPPGTVDALLADKAALTAVLTYHVVAGKVTAADVAGLTEATTVQGGTIKIDTSNGVKINDATVTTADVMASNGVIHVIDTVLMPPQ